MHVRDFERKLKKLNPRIVVYYGPDPSKPAGIMYKAATWNGVEYQSICGIDKGFLPEHPITDKEGHILKGGWRRVLALLVAQKIIDVHKSFKYFGPWLSHNVPAYQPHQENEIDKELKRTQEKGYFKRDELVDIGREINKCKPVKS